MWKIKKKYFENEKYFEYHITLHKPSIEKYILSQVKNFYWEMIKRKGGNYKKIMHVNGSNNVAIYLKQNIWLKPQLLL